jgi:hypothetical protein
MMSISTKKISILKKTSKYRFSHTDLNLPKKPKKTKTKRRKLMFWRILKTIKKRKGLEGRRMKKKARRKKGKKKKRKRKWKNRWKS